MAGTLGCGLQAETGIAEFYKPPTFHLFFKMGVVMVTKKGLTYAEAGVDIAAGNRAVELMKEHVQSTGPNQEA